YFSTRSTRPYSASRSSAPNRSLRLLRTNSRISSNVIPSNSCILMVIHPQHALALHFQAHLVLENSNPSLSPPSCATINRPLPEYARSARRNNEAISPSKPEGTSPRFLACLARHHCGR